MRARELLSLCLAGSFFTSNAQGLRIVHSNSDGWAELNARETFNTLKKAGHDIILSAPAEDKSVSWTRDKVPKKRTEPCQFDSCEANSGPWGQDGPEKFWVNSYPVTAMRYGIDKFGPGKWNSRGPELAISGPNVGYNLWKLVGWSGTVSAAAFAANFRNIPAIAFAAGPSGWSNKFPFYMDNPPDAPKVHAELVSRLVGHLELARKGGGRLLPSGTFLNVNFAKVTGSQCTDPAEFIWAFTRIGLGWFSEEDVEHCGSTRLPHESAVVGSEDACYVTISVGDADSRHTASAAKQAELLRLLGHIFVCPSDVSRLTINT